MLWRSPTCQSAQARQSAANAGSVEIDLILSTPNSRSRAGPRSASIRDRTASSCDMVPTPFRPVSRRLWDRVDSMLLVSLLSLLDHHTVPTRTGPVPAFETGLGDQHVMPGARSSGRSRPGIAERLA